MKIVTVKIPRSYIDDIDKLVKKGYYASRSEFIRTALRILLDKEFNRLIQDDATSTRSGVAGSERNYNNESLFSSSSEKIISARKVEVLI
ncbi:MAG: ribbon-helix-helix domain-containing protein [Sulfolobales archaeon]